LEKVDLGLFQCIRPELVFRPRTAGAAVEVVTSDLGDKKSVKFRNGYKYKYEATANIAGTYEVYVQMSDMHSVTAQT
jgi:hypothetical protein